MGQAFHAVRSSRDATADGANEPPEVQRFDTSQLSLHEGLVRELLQRAKARPELSDLFQEGCNALVRADEANRLPNAEEDRALAFSELLAVHRRLLDQVSLIERSGTRR